MTAPATPRTTPVTCAADGRSHRVTDDGYAAGLAAGSGRYTALCGHRVLAASLVCPPGPACRGCAAAGAPHSGGWHRRTTRRGRHRGGDR